MLFRSMTGIDRESGSGVLETAGSFAALGFMMDGLNFVPAKTKNLYEITLAKYAPTQVIESVNAKLKAGELTQQEANKIIEPILEKRDALKDIPQGANLETVAKALPLVIEKNKLLKQGEESDVAKQANEAKVEALHRKIHEELGTPLTMKEAKQLEKLNEIAKDAEDRLTPTEIKERNHLRKRKTASEKAVEEAEKPKEVKAGKQLFSEPDPNISKVVDRKSTRLNSSHT